MTTPIGKFDVRPDIRFISRWDVEMRQEMGFNDPVHGLIVVPNTFVSDLASIRILREICRWCAVTALTGGTLVDSYPWTRAALIVIAVIALAIYGLLVGYGMRASILHDWLYTFGPLTRRECDDIYYRALTTGDGTARWRAWIFFLGVRLGGHWSYTKTPTSPGASSLSD
ncbi:DUF1353 domain-containing protein [Pseudomonas sp. G.S.17]|uniref:DUF1353 domain-containing protein n=1 Tax=Pseudomonas sp. G.S.17 TaxID=3137451 RepID=UPI00311C8A24